MKTILKILMLTFLVDRSYAQSKVNIKYERNKNLLLWNQEKFGPKGIEMSDSVLRLGRKTVRFVINKTDSTVANGKRAEISLKSEPFTKADRWYAFSNFLPSSYVIDPQPEIVAQWHEIPDFDLGESWRSPPISLQTENGHWMLHVLSAKDKVNTNLTISGHLLKDLGVYKTNTWNDWVFHIKFSWEDDGLLEIWRNGELLLSVTGPNCYNDENLPYLKLGLYKWVWLHKDLNPPSTTTRREIFYDRVRMGNELSTLKTISKN